MVCRLLPLRWPRAQLYTHRGEQLPIADAGRDGETRYLGEIDSAPVTVEGVIKKLASKYERRYGFVMKLDQGVMGSIGRS